jgi:DUF1365 family protein
MKSAIYEGLIRHRRMKPRSNEFEYRMFMMFLDLDERPQVFQKNPLWSLERFNLACFRRSDYMGPADLPLDEAVRRKVFERTGVRPEGPIRMLTHLRYFGHCFNPATFYYCYDPSGTRVEAIAAEINNTPWKERHTYVLREGENEGAWKRFRFGKEFHVSPFMGMDIDYDWNFRDPDERIGVHMTNFENGEKLFDATLNLERVPITGWSLTRVLLRFPAMTVKVVAAIHWQALKLWWKRTPFHPHPAKAGLPLENL